MSSWIRGRFEGTTVGELCDGPSHQSHARRYAVTLHSGTVTDAERVPEPETEDEPRSDEIRQDRVRRVELPISLIGGDRPEEGCGERTLFDVRICDFRLEYPVEAGGRSYSKIVGTILARLVPALEPALADAPSDARMTEDEPKPPRTLRVHTAGDRLAAHQETTGLGAAEQMRALQWSLAILFLLVGAFGIGLACGVPTAGVWAAPVALVMGVRRVVRPAPLRTPALQWWIGGGALLWQLGVLYRPLDLAWQLGCRTPIRDDLLWLAAPIAVAALVRSRWSLCVTTLVWTGVLCSWCSQLGGSCTRAEIVPPPATAPVVAPARTDADGRWPVMPPAVGRLEGGEGMQRSRSSESDAADTGGGSSSGAIDGASGDLQLSQPLRDETARSEARMDAPTPGVTQPAVDLPTPVAPSLPASPPALAPRAMPSTSGGKGGWIAPDHRRTAREMVLISVEQANRTPQSFFATDANRRVYLPSDRIFEQGSTTVSQRGALELTRLAALVSLHPEQRVALDVHTDAAGAPETQLHLSERRATALLDWLADRGHLDPAQIEAGGLGGSRPIVPPDGSYKDQKPNRRIEVRLID